MPLAKQPQLWKTTWCLIHGPFKTDFSSQNHQKQKWGEKNPNFFSRLQNAFFTWCALRPSYHNQTQTPWRLLLKNPWNFNPRVWAAYIFFARTLIYDVINEFLGWVVLFRLRFPFTAYENTHNIKGKLDCCAVSKNICLSYPKSAPVQIVLRAFIVLLKRI